MKLLYIILASLLCLGGSLAHEKAKIDLFFESQCPDTRNFIDDQLMPAVSGIKDHIELNFIIYGNANVTFHNATKTVFKCQHGDRECEVNEIQLCGVKYAADQYAASRFIQCTQMHNAYSLEKCAADAQIDVQLVSQCYANKAGAAMMYEASKATDAADPKITWIPSVAINGVQNVRARDALIEEVCKTLKDKPSVCC